MQSFPFPRLVDLPKLKNPVHPIIYLQLGGGKTDGFIPFPRALILVQTASSRSWTQIANFISDNDDH